jgi:protein gp37
MADTTLIAWTDHTANFWMGCQKISDGCKNCYAETLTKNRMGLSLWGPEATTARQAVKGVYANVRSWAKEDKIKPGVMGPGQPHLVFVGSLMDWAEDHADAERVRPLMWQTIRENPAMHFQMLTKRPDRIAGLLPPDWGPDGYPNVWLGTSIEDMRVAYRADYLRKIPAAVRFISYEPAIGPLDDLDITGIDWIIYGGESGSGFRPHDLAWPRAIHKKCTATGCTFFYKQSAAYRTEMGIELDGKLVRYFPTPRATAALGQQQLI